MTTFADIETKLTEMADSLLAKAMAADSSLDAVDVFKAVSTWYLGTSKVKAKEPSDPSGSFNAIKATLNGETRQ